MLRPGGWPTTRASWRRSPTSPSSSWASTRWTTSTRTRRRCRPGSRSCASPCGSRRTGSSSTSCRKEGGGKLSTFLTAPFSFMNKPLAAYYGVSGPERRRLREGVARRQPQASGVLTQAGLPGGARHPRRRPDLAGVPGDLRAREPAVPAGARPAPQRPGREPALHARDHAARVGLRPHGQAGVRGLPPADRPHGLRLRELRPHRQVAHHGPGQAGRRHAARSTAATSTAPSTAWSSWARSSPAARWCSDCVATQWFRFAAGRSRDRPRPVQREHAAGRLRQVGRATCASCSWPTPRPTLSCFAAKETPHECLPPRLPAPPPPRRSAGGPCCAGPAGWPSPCPSCSR